MTPCEKLGYKVGDRFEVIDSDNFLKWPVGTIVVLHRDDRTYAPRFRKEDRADEQCYMDIKRARLVMPNIKSGSTITQDGKKYRVTLEEIPQYDFKPGMICRVDWRSSDDACCNHFISDRVVYVGNRKSGREIIAYATTDGDLAIGYVKTSSLRPE